MHWALHNYKTIFHPFIPSRKKRGMGSFLVIAMFWLPYSLLNSQSSWVRVCPLCLPRRQEAQGSWRATISRLWNRVVPCAAREWSDSACFNMAIIFCLDSPSIMDISITSEPEEKKPNVNNVPDYINDIHTYLREMEVSCRLFLFAHSLWGEKLGVEKCV